MLKNNANGEKKSKAINIDKFEQGAKWSGLSDAIDLEYYGIIWSKDTKNYIYRYWYENDAGDDQPVVLNVTFDTDNKYLYYFLRLFILSICKRVIMLQKKYKLLRKFYNCTKKLDLCSVCC